LVRVEDGYAASGPIGSTRPRGSTPDEDEELTQELINSVKERAEHVMLVNSVRNDLGRVCRWGTVEVVDMLRVEKYTTTNT
jgi:anthranilate/para-aminobenzoate synthase component I